MLANEATALLHGREAAEHAAAETAKQTFEEGQIGRRLPTIQGRSERRAWASAANVQVGFASSNSEARRHVQGGAIRVNDAAVSDDRMVLD